MFSESRIFHELILTYALWTSSMNDGIIIFLRCKLKLKFKIQCNVYGEFQFLSLRLCGYRFHPWHSSGWLGRGKCLVQAVSWKPWGIGSSYLVGTLLGCLGMQYHCGTLIWSFDLVIETPTFKILPGLYLRNCKFLEVDTCQGYWLEGVVCNISLTLI